MAYCSDIKPHKLIDWVMITRAEDIQKSFIRGGPPRGPTPYPFIYHFFKKRHPFRIPFIGERHPELNFLPIKIINNRKTLQQGNAD